MLTERVSSEGRGCRVRFDIDYGPPLGLLGDIADMVLFEKRHEHETELILERLRDLYEATAVT